MSESTQLKQTKKQKKAALFRAKTKGKGKAVREEEQEGNDVPVSENQDELEVMSTDENLPETQEVKRASKKRKRTDVGDKDDGGEEEERAADAEEPKPKKKSKKDAPQRFILFVGNLKYTTSVEAIQQHFKACDPPPNVRLLTPKQSSSTKTTSKSKGCAFLEFAHKSGLQQALKLHQSELDGRRINVELTAGGGGKSESRLTKLRERNKGLDDQRKKQVEKLAESGKKVPLIPSRPQRYSATSGVDQAPTTKKTWTVGDVVDDQTHRGGEKHKKRGQKKKAPRAWGTGANAVAVG